MVSAVGKDAVGPAGPISVGDEVIAYGSPGAAAAQWVVPAAAVVPQAGERAVGRGRRPAADGDHRGAPAGGAGRPGRADTARARRGGSGSAAVGATRRCPRCHGDRHGQRGAARAGCASSAPRRSTYGAGLLERVRAAAPGGVDSAADLVGTDEAVDVSLAARRAPANWSPPSPRSAAPTPASDCSAAGGRRPGNDDPQRRPHPAHRGGGRRPADGHGGGDLPAGPHRGRAPPAAGRARRRQDRAYSLTASGRRVSRPATARTGPAAPGCGTRAIGTTAPYSRGAGVPGVPDRRAARD